MRNLRSAQAEGLKGEDDGSPQHYLGVSSARSRCCHRARAGGPTACPEHGSAAVACPARGKESPAAKEPPIVARYQQPDGSSLSGAQAAISHVRQGRPCGVGGRREEPRDRP